MVSGVFLNTLYLYVAATESAIRLFDKQIKMQIVKQKSTITFSRTQQANLNSRISITIPDII